MANLLRRATEYIRDDASFLSIVSPAPLTEFLAKHPRKEELFELPVRVVGALGSGKTMLATLAEFHLVEMILRDQTSSTNRELAAPLEQAGFLRGGLPRLAAVRIPMESEHRTFWELPYDPVVKTKLFLWLIQARAMIGLLRNLTAGGRRPLEDIRLVAREASEAQIATIGGLDCRGLQARALEVQRTLHGLAAGLVAPPIEQLPPIATEPYVPFEAILSIEVYWESEPIMLTPLVMLDDVHELHPEQRDLIFSALARREIRFGRWMIMLLFKPVETLSTCSCSLGSIDVPSTASDKRPDPERRRITTWIGINGGAGPFASCHTHTNSSLCQTRGSDACLIRGPRSRTAHSA